MTSVLAALLFALSLPVLAQNLEEAPGASELPPAPPAPSTGDLNDAVNQLSKEQKAPRHEPGPAAKRVKPSPHHEPKKKSKPKKEKAAKKAAKSKAKKKKKKH